MKTGLALIVVLCVATATFPCFEAKQELMATRKLKEFDSTTDFESGEVSTDGVAEPGRRASVPRKLRQSASAASAAAARASGGSASSFAAGAARANGGGGSASAASAARARANGNSASAFSAARARAGAGNSGFFPFFFPLFFG